MQSSHNKVEGFMLLLKLVVMLIVIFACECDDEAIIEA